MRVANAPRTPRMRSYTASDTRWLARFNAMFKEFGPVPDPLPPDRYYEGKLFLSA